jgi:hypothetical protein
VVEEHVLSGRGLNEAESLVVNQLLDLALGHASELLTAKRLNEGKQHAQELASSERRLSNGTTSTDTIHRGVAATGMSWVPS